MKRRNWALLVVVVIGVVGFALSRTVYGPPGKAGAAEPTTPHAHERNDDEPMSDAERRYLNNQPRHWRYIMLKRQ